MEANLVRPVERKYNVLSIVSLTMSLMGFSLLPFVGSIAGLITGYISRKEIHESPERYEGEGLAKAGIILGWLGVILPILIFAVAIAFFLPVATVIH